MLVNLILTRKCPLKCNYCKVVDGEVSTVGGSSWIYGIDKIAKKFGKDKTWFVLFGGEPMLHPEVERIISYLNEKDYGYIVSTTGAPAFDLKTKLARNIAVSVDALETDTELMKLPHHEKKSQWGWRILSNSKKRNLTVAGIVITKDNFHRVPQIAQNILLQGQSKTVISADIVQVNGDIVSSESDLRPSKDQIQWLLENLPRDCLTEPEEFYTGWLDKGYSQTWKCAGKGIKSLMIDADGSISVCQVASKKINMNLFDPNFEFNDRFERAYKSEQALCKGCYLGCLWTTYEKPDVWIK